MSLLTTLIAFVWAFVFDFLLSIKGVFAFLAGFVIFLALPIVPKLTGEFKKFSNLHIWLATSLLGRMAIVVSEHGDLLFKQMSFDDLGVEKISFGSESKEFEDPAGCLHYFFNIPFALAHEPTGVLFDPRYAALGMRKSDAKERGEMTIDATQGEWDDYTVHKWKRGVFEFPKNYFLVKLEQITELVDGGERAEYPKRVEEIYKHSRAPLEDSGSATRFILVVVALTAPFAMMWLLATQGTGGGGGGGGTTLSPGSGALLAISTGALAQRLKEIEWKRIAAITAVVVPLPVIFLLLFVFLSPLTAIFAFLTVGIGFWFLPLLTVPVRPIGLIAEPFARLLFQLGFMGYEKPIFEWTPEKYQLVEAADLDYETDVTWYGLAGSLVGFTFPPEEDVWGAAHMDHDDIKTYGEARPDGGKDDTNIPAKYVRAPAVRRASSYAAFVPKRPKKNKYYVNTGISTGRFSDSATGERSLSRLLWAKEVHGGEGGLKDKTLLYSMLGSGLVSLLLGVFVFFL